MELIELAVFGGGSGWDVSSITLVPGQTLRLPISGA